MFIMGVLGLTACAIPQNPTHSSFTSEEKAALGNVEVFPAKLNAEAWQGIDATDTSTAGKIYTNAVFASGGDNIVGAIGSSITQGIAKGQQRDFEQRNTAHLATIKSAAVSSRLTQALDQTVRAALAQTPLAAKMRPHYQAKMFVNIVKSGYRRVGLNAQEEVLLTPFVQLDIVWISVDPPKVHLNQSIERWAAAPHHHTAVVFANQPALREAAYKAILDSIGGELALTVKGKFVP